MAKKVFKTIGKVLLIILAAALALILGLFISHRIQVANEEKTLTEKGYLNRVSIGEYSLNVCSYGSDTPKHTIVGLSGKGVHNYSVAMRPTTDRLSAENKIVFVDRAGYGLSDDTNVPQTTERVVEDYRQALKNAGIPAPYVLVPHSLGGIYATYWESKYPDEIEGIVFLDCTQISDDEIIFPDYKVDFSYDIMAFLCNLGLQRPLFRFFDPNALFEAPDELYDINKAVIMNRAYTRAMISEEDNINQNCYFAYKNIITNDVPKLYICDSAAVRTKEDFKEMLDIINAQNKKTGAAPLEMPSDEALEAYFADSDKFLNETILPYLDKLGNCEIKYLIGTHMLYVTKPAETAEMIQEFLNTLEE